MRKEITIICATYNAGHTINDLFVSLKKQTNTNYQFIIIDGGSNDNTLNLIKNNLDLIDYWISEPDNGIYDAWNKGISLAKNEWISFVGADDILRPNYVDIYVQAINNSSNNKLDYISSNVSLINSSNNSIRTLGKPFIWEEFKYKMTTAHVGSLHNRSLFEKVGNYDTTYKIIGDYELLLRKKEELKTFFLDTITVEMRIGGASWSYKALKERYRAHQHAAKIPKVIATLILIRGVLELSKFNLELFIRKKINQ